MSYKGEIPFNPEWLTEGVWPLREVLSPPKVVCVPFSVDDNVLQELTRLDGNVELLPVGKKQ